MGDTLEILWSLGLILGGIIGVAVIVFAWLYLLFATSFLCKFGIHQWVDLREDKFVTVEEAEQICWQCGEMSEVIRPRKG